MKLGIGAVCFGPKAEAAAAVPDALLELLAEELL
jgi:hypothetical protein